MTSIIKVQNIQYTDGDAALTIADGGGVTLASDLTVDTTTLKVDSSNNRVGVGTASPDTEFHVKGATTVANFEGTGGSSFIGLKDSDDGTVGFMGVDGGSIKFQTSGSSYSDKLVIDTNGHVTMPKQPAFMIGKSDAHVTSVGTVVFQNVFFNEGSHYNTSNGIFTAPVTGFYLFHAFLLLTNNLSLADYYWSFTYNGSPVAYCYQNNLVANKHLHYSNAIVYKMNANDTMQVYNHNANWYGIAGQHGQFHGYLIG